MNLSKKIEFTANLLIIVLAVTLTSVLVKKFFLTSPVPETIKVGEKIHTPNIILTEARKTVLVFLQPDCPYCTESAEFYRRLKSSINKDDVRSVALFSSEVENEQSYLKKLNVDFDDVKKISFDELKIQYTPTILLTNKDGVIDSVWTGKLSPEMENKLLNQLY